MVCTLQFKKHWSGLLLNACVTFLQSNEASTRTLQSRVCGNIRLNHVQLQILNHSVTYKNGNFKRNFNFHPTINCSAQNCLLQSQDITCFKKALVRFYKQQPTGIQMTVSFTWKTNFWLSWVIGRCIHTWSAFLNVSKQLEWEVMPPLRRAWALQSPQPPCSPLTHLFLARTL